MLVNAFCDGAISTWGARGKSAVPQPLTSLDWIRFHYDNVVLPCDPSSIEVETPSFLTWLMPDLTAEGHTDGKLEPAASSDLDQVVVADEASVRVAVRQVYDLADAQGVRPPNINEIVEPTRLKLGNDQKSATAKMVKSVADEEEFRSRRLGRGKRPASRLKRLGDLKL